MLFHVQPVHQLLEALDRRVKPIRSRDCRCLAGPPIRTIQVGDQGDLLRGGGEQQALPSDRHEVQPALRRQRHAARNLNRSGELGRLRRHRHLDHLPSRGTRENYHHHQGELPPDTEGKAHRIGRRGRRGRSMER
jgi:hypothetical protein